MLRYDIVVCGTGMIKMRHARRGLGGLSVASLLRDDIVVIKTGEAQGRAQRALALPLSPEKCIVISTGGMERSEIPQGENPSVSVLHSFIKNTLSILAGGIEQDEILQGDPLSIGFAFILKRHSVNFDWRHDAKWSTEGRSLLGM